ncbi:MAG: cupredoxin family copper-binding protein [Gemmatimonadota bacterium]
MRSRLLLPPFLILGLCTQPLLAQRLMERTPNLPNSVSALPGMLEVSLPHRFAGLGGASGLQAATTFDVAVGLPFLLPVRWTGGVRFSQASEAVPERTDEWEIYDRLGLLRQATGAMADLNVTGAYNLAARSLDAEAALARQAGPLRLIGVARAMSAAYGTDDLRFALGGGAVWHVRPRNMGVTLAADLVSLLDRRAASGADRGEDVAWSVGLQAGLPYTSLAFGLQASNAATTTIQGASLGTSRTRYGFELNAPVEFLGFVLGWYTDRERAMETVREDADAPPEVRVTIQRFLFTPGTIRIRAGQTIEWVNQDAAVHTVNAENAAFQSGAIQPGSSWRARFDQPGRFPYYCGPHPFMKGVVVVTG